MNPGTVRTLVAEGRYAIFHAGEECGEEELKGDARRGGGEDGDVGFDDMWILCEGPAE